MAIPPGETNRVTSPVRPSIAIVQPALSIRPSRDTTAPSARVGLSREPVVEPLQRQEACGLDRVRADALDPGVADLDIDDREPLTLRPQQSPEAVQRRRLDAGVGVLGLQMAPGVGGLRHALRADI